MPPAALRSPAELAGAANPYNAARMRRVSAAGLALTSGEIVTQIQLGGSRTDSLVQILHAQPRSLVSATRRAGYTSQFVEMARRGRPTGAASGDAVFLFVAPL